MAEETAVTPEINGKVENSDFFRPAAIQHALVSCYSTFPKLHCVNFLYNLDQLWRYSFYMLFVYIYIIVKKLLPILRVVLKMFFG